MAIGALISIPPVASTVAQGVGAFNAVAGKFSGNATVNKTWNELFLFDYAGEVKFTGATEITDHVMEDGTVIANHVAIKPVKVTMQGFAGLVTLSRSQIQGGIFGAAQNLVGLIPAYAGKYTPGAAATISSAISQTQIVSGQVNSILSQGKSLAAVFGKASKIQQVFDQLEGYRKTGYPLTMLLPFSKTVFKNMIIETLSVTEIERTKTLFDFTVTLKQVQYVSTLTAIKILAAEPSTAAQQATAAAHGLASGIVSNATKIASIFGVGP